jgi:hypothetical protein
VVEVPVGAEQIPQRIGQLPRKIKFLHSFFDVPHVSGSFSPEHGRGVVGTTVVAAVVVSFLHRLHRTGQISATDVVLQRPMFVSRMSHASESISPPQKLEHLTSAAAPTFPRLHEAWHSDIYTGLLGSNVFPSTLQ